MEKCNIWSDLVQKLQSHGIEEKHVQRLLSNIERDELVPLIKDIARKICNLRRIISFSLEAGIDGREIAEKLSTWINEISDYLYKVLLDLSRDPKYMRLLFRRKDKAEKYREKLTDILRQLEIIEKKVIEETKRNIREKLSKMSDPRAETIIYTLDYGEPAALLGLLDEVLRLIREGQLEEKASRPKTEGQKLVTTGEGKEGLEVPLSDMYESLRDLREGLLSSGIKYLYLESLHSALEVLPEEVVRKDYLPIREFSDRVRFYGSLLLQLSDEYLKIKADLEEMRGDLVQNLRDAGYEELSEIIGLIGISTMKFPIVISDEADIQFLAREIQRVRSLLNGLREALREVGTANHGGTRKEFFPYTTDETLLLGTIINFLRVNRFQTVLGREHHIPGVLGEVVNLYSIWRSHILNLLGRKKQVRLDEIRYIPSKWKPWVLENLEREGVIRIQEDVIFLAVPPSPLARKVKLKLEFLGSLLEELEGLLGTPSMNEDLPSIRKEYERIREEWKEDMDENELLKLDAKLGNLIKKLNYKNPLVESL